MPDDLEQMIAAGEAELARLRRLRDITDSPVEDDPDIDDLGEEVLETEVSRFERDRRNWLNPDHQMLKVRSNRGKGRLGARASKFSDDEQRAAVQRAQDLIIEGRPRGAAYEEVATSLGVKAPTIDSWARHHNMLPVLTERSVQRWDLLKREQLFDEMLDVAKQLTDRLQVWIQDPHNPDIPNGFNAANEFKTIAVGAAIAHDKRTGIEDLKLARGLRDVDSQELAGELAAGKRLLEEMHASSDQGELPATDQWSPQPGDEEAITVDPATGEILEGEPARTDA